MPPHVAQPSDGAAHGRPDTLRGTNLGCIIPTGRPPAILTLPTHEVPVLRPRTFTAALFGATLLLAGCGANGDTDAGAADGGSSISVTGTDTLEFEPTELSADAGEIEVELVCEPGVNHNIVIDGEEVAACDAGETATGTIELDPGEYEYVCTVPGHEERMRGTLTVN